MRFLLALILLIPFGLNAATQFTEFYCDSTVGTNINSGSTTNAAAIYTAVNGNWDGTSVYTPTDGSTPASTVSAGMWASIYVDGATNLVQASSGGCIMLITNVAAGVNGAITFQRAAFAGTAPSSSATGRSIKVGGAWNGPYGAISFPFGFLATTATNAPNVFPRCNFKNTAQYNITAAMTHANNGPMRFQGMTATAGDGGKATIDGGNPGGSSYTLLTLSGANNDLDSFIFANNGTGGSSHGVLISGVENILIRCVAHDIARAGLISTAAKVALIECEAYACNKVNTASIGAIHQTQPGTTLVRCISHDNTGGNVPGYFIAADVIMLHCVSYSNGLDGATVTSTAGITLIGCDFYNNGGSGVNLTGSSAQDVRIENCNFIKNTANGITSSGSSLRNGYIANCGFGSGTQTNSSGGIAANLGGVLELSSITYTADQTPWTDPANGDFRINLTEAKASGRGLFTQSTVNSPTNTVAFPDIGAAQSASTNAAATSGGGSYTFAQ